MPRIRDVIFCDYVSQDITGKHNCMGVYFGDIMYPENPDFLPAIFLCIHLVPTEEQFVLTIAFDDPNGRNIVRSDVRVEYPPTDVKAGNVVITFQVPPIASPVPGIYFVRFFDGSNTKLAEFSKKLHIGPMPQIVPRLQVKTSVGDDFKAEFGL